MPVLESWRRIYPSADPDINAVGENWRCVITDEVGTCRTTLPVMELRKSISSPAVESANEWDELIASENVVTAVSDLTYSGGILEYT